MSNPNYTPKPGWPAMTIAQAHALMTQPGSKLEMEDVVIRGVKTRTWKCAPPSLREVVETGRQFKDRTFLVYEDDRATYETFYRATIAFAEELQKRGVEKGDRVAIIMRNLPEWPVVILRRRHYRRHRHAR